jgi:hypothetical protein
MTEMTELKALEIVSDRIRQNRGADAEVEQALSALQKAILLADCKALLAAGALTPANEDDQITGAACDAADSIREQDVRNCLKWKGFTDLAQSSTVEDVIHAATMSVLDLLLPLTAKDSQAYWDAVERAARKLVEHAGLDWTETTGGTA